jgi:hypothetical protein
MALVAGCGGGGGDSGGTIPINPGGGGSANRAPVISSISPNGTAQTPFRISTSASQRIVVAASDPDGDNLTYTWSTDKGQVEGHSPEATLTAASSPCATCVTVKVSDGKGHEVQARCYLSVCSGDDPDPPGPTENRPPIINTLVANPSSVAVDGTSTLTVSAADPDGDTLTYSWTAEGGSIQSEDGATAVWKAPSVVSSCSVTVFVSDGHNTAVSQNIAISVGGADVKPITNGLSARYIQNDGRSAHPQLSQGDVLLSRTDPTINFDWDRKAPTPEFVADPITGNGHDWGVIWRGYIKCDQPGLYTFKAHYDDGFRLWVSDDQNKMQLVVEGWNTGPTSGTPTLGTIQLQGGKWYKLEAQMFEDEDRAYCQLMWQPPGASSFSVVPTSDLRVD